MLHWLQTAVRPPVPWVLCPVPRHTAGGHHITEHVWCSHDAVYHCLSLLSAVGLQEKERNKGQKKSLTPLQQLEEDDFSEQPGADVDRMKTIQVH